MNTTAEFDSNGKEEGVYEEASVYDAWLRNANERDLFKNYFQERLGQLVTASPVSIIDVGCGSGAAGLRVIEILEKAKIDYKYTGVEPFEDQLRAFKKQLGENPNVNLVCSKFENFQTTESFDIAIVVHALYYVSSMRETIKKIHGFAKKAIIVHHGPRGINEVHEKFREHVKEGPHIISTYEDIANVLDEEGIPYNLDTFPSEVDVRPIKEAGNEDGKKLIQFFLERTDLSDEVMQKVRDYFIERPDTMIHDVGIIITNPN